LQKRFLLIALLATSLILLGYSCTKIDTTTQGADLVTVDNINTFDTILDVSTQQGFFASQLPINNGDSTVVSKGSNHILGQISDDGLFGKTDASIFVQFKPDFFPFYFGNAGDTTKKVGIGNISPAAGFDSIVLCLSYKGSWGDTSAISPALRVQVLRINDPAFADKYDTIRSVGVYPLMTPSSQLLGQKDITLKNIADTTYYGRNGFGLPRESVQNQIRIKLDSTFGAEIFRQDSLSTAADNAFNSDALFRAKFKGFEIKVTSTNGRIIHYINLAETKTRLEFHYKKVRGPLPANRDTVMQPFLMYQIPGGTRNACATANYIVRGYAGTPATSNNSLNTQYLFLQTNPGTYGKLQISGLAGLNNRIIHRAYLIVDQDPASPVETDVYSPPPYMYVDLKDTVTTFPQKYKPVYFDLTNRAFYNPDAVTTSDIYFPTSNVDINSFGGVAQKRYDAGSLFYRYEINLTRYVQHIVTNKYKNYDLRLYTPSSFIYPQYAGINSPISYFNPLALGRVRVGGGGLPNTSIHKMKMRVIYSLIK
jgi:hypothetical protein